MKTILLFVFFIGTTYNNAQDTMVTQLFNSKDLTGWEHLGSGSFIIDDGMLKTAGGMGLLWYTKEKFGNAILKVVYRTVDSSNSGVFIRIPESPEDEWAAVNKGYEVQIDESDDAYHCTGVLYSFTKAKARPGKINEWNTMEIILNNDRTIVKLNGVEVTNYKEGDEVPPKINSWEPDRGKRPAEGYIGLQNHADNDMFISKKYPLNAFLKNNIILNLP